MRAGLPRVVSAVVQEMHNLMTQLQVKVQQDTIPRFFPRGAPIISGTVRQEPPVHVEGTLIIGSVAAGTFAGREETLVTAKRPGPGVTYPVDYAYVQEFGGRDWYWILPFDKKALAFSFSAKSTLEAGFGGGAEVVVSKVHHPPLSPRPFMRTAQEEMREQIIAGLQGAAEKALAG
jgi:hypothetical protein